MSDLITTTQDSFRDKSIELYVGLYSALESLGERMAERARENRGQTAAEYMGVLLVVSVIIAAVAQTGVGGTIARKLTSLVNLIAQGKSGTG
jgi:Flp pilus assembly pilin Flp